MDRDEYLESLRRDAAGLLAAARAADPATVIAGCPEWVPADLVWHIGEVHGFWGTIVEERRREPIEDWPPPRPVDDAGVWSFAEDSARVLRAALEAAGPDTPVWTWAPQQDAAFVLRRMAHETAVHRVDAERAAGRDWRVDARLAADGVDEFLTWFLPYAHSRHGPLGGSVHLHCTDVDGEWTVRDDADGGLVVARDHAKADAAVRGPAHDLLMVLWRRDDLDAVEVFGDRDLAARFVALTVVE